MSNKTTKKYLVSEQLLLIMVIVITILIAITVYSFIENDTNKLIIKRLEERNQEYITQIDELNNQIDELNNQIEDMNILNDKLESIEEKLYALLKRDRVNITVNYDETSVQ